MTYRQRTWSDESEMWCGICDVASSLCLQPDNGNECVTCFRMWPNLDEWCSVEPGHAAQWVTMQERAREQAESDAYEIGHDAEETR